MDELRLKVDDRKIAFLLRYSIEETYLQAEAFEIAFSP